MNKKVTLQEQVKWHLDKISIVQIKIKIIFIEAQIQSSYNNSADIFTNQRKQQPDIQNQLRLLKSKMNQNSIHQNDIERQETNLSYELNNINARLSQKPNYQQQQQDIRVVPRNRVYNQDTINNSQNSTNLTNFSEPQKDLASRISNKFNQYQIQQEQKQVQNQTPIKYQPSIRNDNSRFQYTAQQNLNMQDNYQQIKQYPSQQDPFKNQYQQQQYIQPKTQQQQYNQYRVQNDYPQDKNSYTPIINRNPPKSNLKSIDEIPAVAKQKPNIPTEIYDSQDQELIECPEGCGRQFNEVSMQKHVKVCKKVFQSKRKEFNSKAHRQVAQEQGKLEKLGKMKDQQIQNKKQQGKQGKEPKWKKQSEQFRQMLSNMKKGDNNQVQISNAIEDDYVECPSCGRRFNEHAAARHIPSCQQRAKVNRFRGKK